MIAVPMDQALQSGHERRFRLTRALIPHNNYTVSTMRGFGPGQPCDPKEAQDTPFAYWPARTHSGAKTVKATCFEGSYVLQKLQKLGNFAVVVVDRRTMVELQASRTLK
jgi:hypothetical protein